MRRFHFLFAGAFLLACGGSQKEDAKTPGSGGASPDGGDVDGAVAAADAAPAAKASPCTGTDLDLAAVLIQSACEIPNPSPEAKAKDITALLDVKVTSTSTIVSPGGHIDLLVTFTNKSKAPLALDFQLDPTPRFSVEAYNSVNARAEMPKNNPPNIARPGSASEPLAPSTAEINIVPSGTAFVRLGWDAVRLKWAPEKLKGSLPELGFPTSPAGPLPKGTYMLKVVTPMTGVFEGVGHDVSSPKITVKVQ
jgi:hypothetical protein